MSDMLMDMQRPRTTDEILTNPKQYNNYDKNIYNYEHDQFYNNSVKSPAKRYSSRHSTSTDVTTTAGDANANADADEYDEFANILSLQLRKPKHWRWELSTSRSCANIALPRILLYDHKGQLLLDANSQREQCYNQPKEEKGDGKSRAKPEQISSSAQHHPLKRAAKAATSSLAHSIRKALHRQFSDLQIQEATPSPAGSKNRSMANTPSTEHSPSTPLSATIDFYTNELPDYELQRRANSLKGVRFKVNDELKSKADITGNQNMHSSFNLANLPTPPSTITTTTTPTTSSSSGPREKRRYRRSNSSVRSPETSESILERFSFNKGRFSSPEYVEEQKVNQPQRYFLRTSKAGTLMVPHESFSRYRRRRRTRNNSSTDNLQSGTGSGSKSSLKMSDSGKKGQTQSATGNSVMDELSCGSWWNVSERDEGRVRERKKLFPARRHRSDVNVLLHQRSLSSEEEPVRTALQMSELEEKHLQPPHRKFGNRSRKQSKTELIIKYPENGVQPGADCSESR